MPQDTPSRRPGEWPDWLSIPPLRYPFAYVWLVLLSAADVICTALILSAQGREVNPVAWAVISHWGFNAATLLKFSLTLFAIVLCEAVGRLRDGTGRRLARAMLLIAAIPVVWSVWLLGTHWRDVELDPSRVPLTPQSAAAAANAIDPAPMTYE